MIHNAIRGTTIAIDNDWSNEGRVSILHIRDAAWAILQSAATSYYSNPDSPKGTCGVNFFDVKAKEPISLKILVEEIIEATHSLSTLFVLPVPVMTSASDDKERISLPDFEPLVNFSLLFFNLFLINLGPLEGRY